MMHSIFLFSAILIVASFGRAEDEFANRKILFIGASTGMGKSAADLVYARGGKVVYCGRTLSKVEKAIEGKDKRRAFALQCDGGDLKSMKDVVQQSYKLMSGLDGLMWGPTFVSPHAFAPPDVLIAAEDYTDTLRSSFTYNVDNFFATFSFALPYLKESNQSSVVSISSIAAVDPGMFTYSIAKAAQDALVENLAIAYAHLPIRVNSFQAGPYDTDIFPTEEMRQGIINQLKWRSPMQRIGTADEGGEFIAFLLSSRSSYMTGENIRADGMVSKSTRLTDFFGSYPHLNIMKYQDTNELCRDQTVKSEL